MEELAEEAGIPVRTVRFYRERKLIPPPRREGRIAWYNDHHLARLRTIAALLERGHTLTGIADLAATFDSGRDVGELLSLGAAPGTPSTPGVPGITGAPGTPGAPTEEVPVRLTPEQLADYFEGEVTPENLASAMALGYLAVDGDEVVHISRRLLDVSAALVREGVPLSEVMAAGLRVREHADVLAQVFIDLVTTHDADPRRLRPLAKSVVAAELSLALDRHLAP
ncbi:MerR family transcriptional regulator [Streptomyces sp. CA-294286]|uniref:MerR family transcriptional regulator n=1 Tax=Streptomyces sp. CA-294286 TaxID=3240070 RepID=UPI003D931A53